MVKYQIKDIDAVRLFCKKHFADICSYSRFDVIPSGDNFSRWFNIEVYPALRDDSFFPIIIQDELAGFCILDLTVNQYYDLKTKTVLLKSIYVSKEFRGSIKILKFLLKLKIFLEDLSYKRLLCETSVDNTPVKKLIRAFGGKNIFGTHEIPLD